MALSLHPFTDYDHLTAIVECRQCGHRYQTYKRYMSEDRPEIWWLCTSCKAKPITKVVYDGDYCVAWQGDFDDDALVCLDDNGKPVHVGKRSCGHADCVRQSHLLA